MFVFHASVGVSLSSLHSQQYLEILAFIFQLFFHGQSCAVLWSETVA